MALLTTVSSIDVKTYIYVFTFTSFLIAKLTLIDTFIPKHTYLY